MASRLKCEYYWYGLLIFVLFSGVFGQGNIDPPAVSPDSRQFVDSLYVVMQARNIDWDIYYTLNGDTPSVNSTKYTTPFVIRESMTLMAVCLNNGINSPVAVRKYSKISIGLFKSEVKGLIVDFYVSKQTFNTLGRRLSSIKKNFENTINVFASSRESPTASENK